MTSPDTDTRHDTDAIIEAARLGMEPTELELGTIWTKTQADGSVALIDLTTSAHLAQMDALAKREGEDPARKTGSVLLTEHASFSEYVKDHADEFATSLYGDRRAGRIIAVLNGHDRGQEGAGWGDHRATLQLTLTEAWTAWVAASGKLVGQEEFAEFLEDQRLNVVAPDAATLLEIVTTIQAKTAVAFKSAIRLDDGQVQIGYEENTETTAGQAGTMTVPSEITLALTPYEGMQPFQVTARLRTRVRDGRLSIGVVLDQPEDVLRAAFNQVVVEVEVATEHTVLHGTPGS